MVESSKTKSILPKKQGKQSCGVVDSRQQQNQSWRSLTTAPKHGSGTTQQSHHKGRERQNRYDPKTGLEKRCSVADSSGPVLGIALTASRLTSFLPSVALRDRQLRSSAHFTP
ncbi:hypothetical protein PIB30_093986 [Stylosanthes scabra]|uniref:Uncharacterized protein n=1 Tax=Stylosanthes scabra TaxID=79078 RepID=A0ABU6QUN5_9FABA|nr:hypothetical protein [Stylosanthes scabra]